MKGVALVLLGFAVLCGVATADSWRGRGSWGGGHGGSWGAPNNYYWPSQYNCRDRGCFTPCPNPEPVTAWDYISTTPELSFMAQLLAAAGYQSTLDQATDWTILAPTNAAFDNYFFNSFSPALLTVLGNDAEKKGVQWKMVMGHFFPTLLPYFMLPEPVFAKDLEVGTWYGTLYKNPNGNPHKVYFGSKDVPIPKGDTVSRYAKPCRNCKKLKYYLMDEQRRDVTISKADKFVEGGGVVHTIDGILQPNDIFPTLLGALKYNNLTSIIEITDYSKDGSWGRNAWGFAESNPSIFVAPTNKACAEWKASLPGGELPSPEIVGRLIRYQNCPLNGPDAIPENLLYTPFTTGKNPALTTLGRAQNNTDLSLLFKASDEDYLVQGLPGTQEAGIVFPDITTPMQVVHAVDYFLTPPLK